MGPGCEACPRSTTCPCACRWCRGCFDVARPPDVVLLHTSTPRRGKVSLGTEVNILPAAIEQARARGGLVVAQVNRADALHPRRRRARRSTTSTWPSRWTRPLPSPARRPVGRRDRRPSAPGWPPSSRTARRSRWGSARSPTPSWPHSTGPRRSACGRRPSPTACSSSTRRGPSTPTAPIVTTFLFGSARALRVRRRQPAGPGAAHRDGERPGDGSLRTRMMCSLNTALQVDLFDQANASFVRWPHLLGLRRAARLRRRGAALRGRPRGHRPRVLARQERHVDHRAPPGRARDLVPALGGGHRAGPGAALRSQPAGPGPAADRRGRPSRRPRAGLVGGAGHAGGALWPRPVAAGTERAGPTTGPRTAIRTWRSRWRRTSRRPRRGCHRRPRRRGPAAGR